MAIEGDGRLLPASTGIVGLIAAFLAWLVPVFVLPFANVLPYLQTMPLLQRLKWSALFFVIAIVVARAAMTRRQWNDVRGVSLDRWSSVAGVSLGLLLAIYAAASLSANTFGLLVKAFPAEPFVQEFVVTSSMTVGSKQRALELELRPSQAGKPYELTLSQRVFGELPQLKPGDVLRVRGEKNAFGSYVQTFTVLSSESR
jgi:hypothetical protein